MRLHPGWVRSAWGSSVRTVTELQLKPESSYSIIQVPSGWCGRLVHRSITASQGAIILVEELKRLRLQTQSTH